MTGREDWRPSMDPWAFAGQKVRNGIPDPGFRHPITGEYYDFHNSGKLVRDLQNGGAVVIQQNGTRIEVEQWIQNQKQ